MRLFMLSLPVIALLCLTAFSGSAFAQFNAFKDPVQGSSASGFSGPDLKAPQANITGGQVTVGSTTYVVAVFKNPGTSPVNVTGINLYPSSTVSAEVNLNKCAEAPLPPEAECAITVAVVGIQPGAWRVELLLDHDGRTRLATAAITGTVSGSAATEDDVVKADIEATPSELDFGSSTGGATLVRAVLLRNRTLEPVDLKEMMLDTPVQSGFSQKSECPGKLLPGELCSVIVSWSPTTRGQSDGVLRVLHTAKSSMTQVAVKGTYEPSSQENAELYPSSVPDKGLLISDKDKIDFGDGIKGASAITVSLVNAGSESVTLKSIKLSGSESGLSIARAGCRAGTILEPIEACALTINWVPSRIGEVIDDLQIHHSGARGILLLPVRGSADEAVSRESLAVRQTAPELRGRSGNDAMDSVTGLSDLNFQGDTTSFITPVLDGYIVTSHSASRAVINGPVGSVVVRDGEDVVISGVKWTVTIISTGVILTSAEDEILLIFDKSLKPAKKADTSSSSSSSSDSSSTSETTEGTSN